MPRSACILCIFKTQEEQNPFSSVMKLYFGKDEEERNSQNCDLRLMMKIDKDYIIKSRCIINIIILGYSSHPCY